MSKEEIAMQLTLKAMETKLIHPKTSGVETTDSPEAAVANQKAVADFYTAMYEAVCKANSGLSKQS